MAVRRAEIKDIPRIEELLYQVHDVHASVRPDLFIKGKKKYTAEELEALIGSEDTIIFVCTDDTGVIMGYAFCMDKTYEGNHSTNPDKMLYIDDLCVDEKFRGRHVGSILCEHVKKYASEEGYQRITLNVWEFNKSARAFYDALGFEPLKTVMEMRL